VPDDSFIRANGPCADRFEFLLREVQGLQSGAGSCLRWPIKPARSYRLGTLQWDPALAAAAQQHCLRMAQDGSISHRYNGEPELTDRAGNAVRISA